MRSGFIELNIKNRLEIEEKELELFFQNLYALTPPTADMQNLSAKEMAERLTPDTPLSAAEVIDSTQLDKDYYVIEKLRNKVINIHYNILDGKIILNVEAYREHYKEIATAILETSVTKTLKKELSLSSKNFLIHPDVILPRVCVYAIPSFITRDLFERRYSHYQLFNTDGKNFVITIVDKKWQNGISSSLGQDQNGDLCNVISYNHEYHTFRHVESNAQLDQIYLYKLLNLYVSHGNNYLITKYIAGENLKTLLSKPSVISDAKRLRIAISLLLQFFVISRTGLPHRDISPEKIIVDENTETAILTGFAAGTSHLSPYTSPLLAKPTTEGVFFPAFDCYAIARALGELLDFCKINPDKKSEWIESNIDVKHPYYSVYKFYKRIISCHHYNDPLQNTHHLLMGLLDLYEKIPEAKSFSCFAATSSAPEDQKKFHQHKSTLDLLSCSEPLYTEIKRPEEGQIVKMKPLQLHRLVKDIYCYQIKWISLDKDSVTEHEDILILDSTNQVKLKDQFCRLSFNKNNNRVLIQFSQSRDFANNLPTIYLQLKLSKFKTDLPQLKLLAEDKERAEYKPELKSVWPPLKKKSSEFKYGERLPDEELDNLKFDSTFGTSLDSELIDPNSTSLSLTPSIPVSHMSEPANELLAAVAKQMHEGESLIKTIEAQFSKLSELHCKPKKIKSFTRELEKIKDFFHKSKTLAPDVVLFIKKTYEIKQHGDQCLNNSILIHKKLAIDLLATIEATVKHISNAPKRREAFITQCEEQLAKTQSALSQIEEQIKQLMLLVESYGNASDKWIKKSGTFHTKIEQTSFKFLSDQLVELKSQYSEDSAKRMVAQADALVKTLTEKKQEFDSYLQELPKEISALETEMPSQRISPADKDQKSKNLNSIAQQKSAKRKLHEEKQSALEQWNRNIKPHLIPDFNISFAEFEKLSDEERQHVKNRLERFVNIHHPAYQRILTERKLQKHEPKEEPKGETKAETKAEPKAETKAVTKEIPEEKSSTSKISFVFIPEGHEFKEDVTIDEVKAADKGDAKSSETKLSLQHSFFSAAIARPIFEITELELQKRLNLAFIHAGEIESQIVKFDAKKHLDDKRIHHFNLIYHFIRCFLFLRDNPQQKIAMNQMRNLLVHGAYTLAEEMDRVAAHAKDFIEKSLFIFELDQESLASTSLYNDLYTVLDQKTDADVPNAHQKIARWIKLTLHLIRPIMQSYEKGGDWYLNATKALDTINKEYGEILDAVRMLLTFCGEIGRHDKTRCSEFKTFIKTCIDHIRNPVCHQIKTADTMDVLLACNQASKIPDSVLKNNSKKSNAKKSTSARGPRR